MLLPLKKEPGSSQDYSLLLSTPIANGIVLIAPMINSVHPIALL